MQVNEIIHGFRVIRCEEVGDVSGTLRIMEHVKTGAKLAWLDREDENMTFSAAFKTTPEDDTGVFHILEHSVLNGSEKYPVREPFVDLLKSSMQTFLNAMTYPDKTVYPVSSRNRKDFMNLTSVYLDAVFRPRIYQEPNIFYQEGWHYEMRSPDEMPAYKGVVHSEMQGNFSSVDTLIVNELNRLVFPDNCYRFVSGGDPEFITDLTYEQFLDAHRRYYHPSNVRFFLDGSIDIDAVLALIDDAYLSGYERIDADPEIPMQKPVTACTSVIPYEVSPEEDLAGKTHAACAKIISRFDDVYQNTAWQILSQILVGTNESPFKKAVIETGLAQDVELELYDGISQPWAVLAVRNTDEEKADAALAAVIQAAREVVANGLDHDEILAALNQMQFQYLEPKEPAGIMYMSSALSSWLYDGDPALYLNCGYVFDGLREKLKEGYFEQLVSDFLLDEEHLVRVIAIPDPKLAEKRRAKETEKLTKVQASWDQETKERLVRENLALDEWQSSEDTKEQKDTLPKLKISDIDRFPKDPEPVERDYHGACVLEYPGEKSGIVYQTLYFSLAGLKLAELPVITTFTSLLRELATENYSAQQLQSEIRRDLGSLSFYADAYRAPDDITACTPVFAVSCSVLEKNLSRAEELISEILFRTVFEKETVLRVLKQDQEGLRQAFIASGSALAGLRTVAHISADGAAREAMNGLTYGKFLKDLIDHFDERYEDLFNEFELLREVLFSRSRLTVSYTGEKNRKQIENFIMEFPYTDAIRCLVHYPLLETGNEAIVIPSPVSYTASSACLQYAGSTYSGVYRTVSQILTYGYLWNEVRVKGGAYGTSFSAALSGLINMTSYRDPHPEASLEVFGNAGAYLQGFGESAEDLDSFVIGAMNSMDPLLSPGSKIRLADARHFTGLKLSEYDEMRQQLLHTSKEDLINAGKVLNEALQQRVSCVVGNREAIDSCKGLDPVIYEI